MDTWFVSKPSIHPSAVIQAEGPTKLRMQNYYMYGGIVKNSIRKKNGMNSRNAWKNYQEMIFGQLQILNL